MNHDIERWIDKLDKREVNFILFILKANQPNTIVPNNNNYLLHLLNNEPYKSNGEGQKFYEFFHGKMVNDEQFNWIKGDLRAALWLNSFYYNYHMNYSIPKVQYHFFNDFLDNFIFNIDVACFTSQTSNIAQNQQPVGPSIAPTQGYVPQVMPEPYLGYPHPMQQQLLKQLHPQQYAQHQQQQYQQQQYQQQQYQQQQYQQQQYPRFGTDAQPQPQQPQTLTSDNNNTDNKSPFFQYNFATQQKIDFLNQAKMVYLRIMTSRKDTKWLDTNNEDQIYWAVEYLKEHNALIIPPLFHPSNIDDIFDQICASLDFMDSHLLELAQPYQVSTNKYLFMSRMRKAWSQKKFRDKKDVDAAQDLLLSRATKKQLMKLSKVYKVSPIDVLSDLIDSAYREDIG